MKAVLVVTKALSVLIILLVSASDSVWAGAAGPPTVAAQFVISDVFESDSENWKPGPGFNLTGSLPVSCTFDVRADWGGRWLEGEHRIVTDEDPEPRWGGLDGETTEGLRVMPATLGLVYRFENLSKGRFWVPYLGTGPGFYDFQATFADAEGNERNDALFEFGWHVRGGVRLHRTSGMHISLETAVHFIDTPGKISPMWEVSLGLGSLVPGRSR